MKLKTASIINILKTNGKIVLKMDRKSGFVQLTITKRGDAYLIGEHPGGRILRTNHNELVEQLNDISMFINKWA